MTDRRTHSFFSRRRENGMRCLASLRVVFGVLVGLAMAITCGVSVARAQPESLVIDPSDVIYGRTYSDWSAAWNQWAYSLPTKAHPLFDTAPCDTGQSGPVFFLGGKFCASGSSCSFTVKRQCTVHGQKALFFPILDFEDSTVEEAFFPTFGPIITDMRKGEANFLDKATKVKVDLDSHQLIPGFRTQSVVFDHTIPADNVFKAVGECLPGPPKQCPQAGTYPVAVDDGLYLMLAPLPSGKHKLHFTGTFPGPFTLDITYNLTVSK